MHSRLASGEDVEMQRRLLQCCIRREVSLVLDLKSFRACLEEDGQTRTTAAVRDTQNRFLHDA